MKGERKVGKRDSRSPTSQSKCLTPLKQWKTNGQQKTNLVVVLNQTGSSTTQPTNEKKKKGKVSFERSELFGSDFKEQEGGGLTSEELNEVSRIEVGEGRVEEEGDGSGVHDCDTTTKARSGSKRRERKEKGEGRTNAKSDSSDSMSDGSEPGDLRLVDGEVRGGRSLGSLGVEEGRVLGDGEVLDRRGGNRRGGGRAERD